MSDEPALPVVAAPHKQWLYFPPALVAVLEDPDVVEVMTVRDEYTDDGKPTGPFYDFHLRGSAVVPTSDRRRAVGAALVRANRSGHGSALCLDAEYAVRVRRGEVSADLLICFDCDLVQVYGPKGMAGSYTMTHSARRAIKRELRRGGVGWLWFWRRWIG